jgi:hypothetical protein
MTASLGALLRGAIDYAGLFPPASLELVAALANYRVYQRSADAWALGRFVVPVGRLAELEGLLQRTQTEESGASAAHRVPLSVLLGSGDAAEIALVEGFNRRSLEHGAKVESVELKAGSADQARAALAQLPADWQRYLEVPLGQDNEAMLDAVRNGGGFAKARTGGITAEAIPSPEELVGFLARVAARKLPFKATAGLHHPLRGDYRLTYAEGSPSATLYGYLNLLLAAAILWKGGGTDRAMEALLEAAPGALRFDAVSLVWRNLRLDAAALAGMRRDFFHSFGSCSFREPLDELAAGGWT